MEKRRRGRGMGECGCLGKDGKEGVRGCGRGCGKGAWRRVER